MKFIKELKKLRLLIDHPTHQMSCLIIDKNKIISKGYNKYKTHPQSRHKYKMLHAELSAVLDNKFADLKGTSIYVYREHKDGSRALSRPCPSCMQTIKLAGIVHVARNRITL